MKTIKSFHRACLLSIIGLYTLPTLALEEITDDELNDVSGQAGLSVVIEESEITPNGESPFAVAYVDKNCGNADCTTEGGGPFYGGIWGFSMNPTNGGKPGFVRFSGTLNFDVHDDGEQGQLILAIENSNLEAYIPEIIVGSNSVNSFDALATELTSNPNFLLDPETSYSSFGGFYTSVYLDSAEFSLTPGGDLGNSGMTMGIKLKGEVEELAWEDDINNGGGRISLLGIMIDAEGTGTMDLATYTYNNYDYKTIRMTNDLNFNSYVSRTMVGGDMGSIFMGGNVSATTYIFSRH